MDSETLKVLGQVAGIGGAALGVFLLLFRDLVRRVLQNVIPRLTRDQAFRLLRLFMILVWSIAVLGIGAWAGCPEAVTANTFTVIGTQSNTVTFYKVSAVLEQSEELPTALAETLKKAENRLRARDFNEALRLLGEVWAEEDFRAPRLAVNLAATYQALADFERAKRGFQWALSTDPADEVALLNSSRIPECRLDAASRREKMAAGGESFQDAVSITPGVYEYPDALQGDVHRYFKVAVSQAQTLSIVFLTPNTANASAGAAIYDATGQMKDSDVVLSSSGKGKVQFRAIETGQLYFTVGAHNAFAPNYPGTVYQVCIW